MNEESKIPYKNMNDPSYADNSLNTYPPAYSPAYPPTYSSSSNYPNNSAALSTNPGPVLIMQQPQQQPSNSISLNLNNKTSEGICCKICCCQCTYMCCIYFIVLFLAIIIIAKFSIS